MPRRPRPSHRAPPRSARIQIQNMKKPLKMKVEEYSNESEAEGSLAASSGDEGSLNSTDEDADALRVSQWIDEDELEESYEEESEEEKEFEAGPSQLKKLETNLLNLPFGVLRNAQYALTRVNDATDPESGDDESDDSASKHDSDVPVSQSNKGQYRLEWSTKPRKDIAKRSNKHAPMEISSKKPVTRFRQVVEVKKIESRDPRFLPTAGEFKAEKFQQNYQFLTEAHGNELSTLKENLKQARKMLDNAPRHLRDDYEVEIQRLELAVKRAESVVSRERMDRIQRGALLKASKEEKEKRKQGKGEWYLKKSEKRELVTRAKYNALTAEGGKRAVKKAIEKKQKKISQKEKRSRPFPKSGLTGEDSRKRRTGEGYDARKRRKVG